MKTDVLLSLFILLLLTGKETIRNCCDNSSTKIYVYLQFGIDRVVSYPFLSFIVNIRFEANRRQKNMVTGGFISYSFYDVGALKLLTL